MAFSKCFPLQGSDEQNGGPGRRLRQPVNASASCFLEGRALWTLRGESAVGSCFLMEYQVH